MPTALHLNAEEKNLLPLVTHTCKSNPPKLVVLIAGILFTVAMDKKTPEQIAMLALMLAATAFPALSDLYADCRGLSDVKHQAIEALCSAFMTAAVGIMEMGAYKELGKSAAADLGFSGIACFSVFSLTNLLCNAARLCQMLKNNDATIQSTPVFLAFTLFSNVFGLIGSILFFITQILGYCAARENNNEPQKKSAELIGVASACFAGVTSYVACNTGQALWNARNVHSEAREEDAASTIVYGAAA